MRHIYCVRQARCERLKQKTCFGSTLPYNFTSLDLTDSYSQEQTLERLYAYQAIKHVPKCWAVIQPFLCAVFLPKCEDVNGKPHVYMPSLEMCRKTQEPCRILYNTTYFPEFLKCSENIFPSKCNNDVREMKFNATGECLPPMVLAESSSSFYKDIEGCGIQCKDPRYTDNEHHQIHKLIKWGALTCFLCNFFTVVTYWIDWYNSKEYPTSLVIFYINFCYMIVCLGWLIQFTPGSREDIVCRRDGTLRHSEPSGGENLSCIIVFILVYYFLIAAMVWFVIFTYSWNLSCKAHGKLQSRIDRKSSYFHLIAWSLPLVLTITTMGLSEVDGDSVTGICFVGHVNHPMRWIFLLGPVLLVLFIGGFFITRGLVTLIKIQTDSKEIMKEKRYAYARKKIRQMIVRMGLCSMFVLMFIVATFVIHINDYKKATLWADSLREYIICLISSTYTDVQSSCKMEHRPSVAILQLHLLCFFASGIVWSSWTWRSSSVESWKRRFRRIINADADEPPKVPKHKVIAQTYAKRKEFQNEGRVSISFKDEHSDPAGLNFHLDSIQGSYDFSSTWAKNLPRLISRRDALAYAATSSNHSTHRKGSMDSEISISVRQFSLESRRNSRRGSLDSQISVKIAEMKTKVASRGSKTKSRHHRHHHRRYSRKESTTSIESQSIITAAIKNRRRGVAPIDVEQINELLANKKLLSPFFKQGLTTSDEDSVGGGGSMKVLKNSQLMLQPLELTEREAFAYDYNTTDDEKMKRSSDVELHSSKERFKSTLGAKGGKIRKNKSVNRRTRKNSRSMTGRRSMEKKEKRDKEKGQSDLLDSNSYFSELYPLELHSSYSGISIAKTNSRNSKRSCDVGIQANAHEIATQTISSYEFNEKNLKDEENHDIYTENHTLLAKRPELKSVAIRRREADTSMSETEKLKMLLLPSK